MNKQFLFLCTVLATIFCGASISCSGLFLRTESVTFSLPAWPPENNAGWPPLSCWEIRYCSGEISGSFTLDPEGSAAQPFSLELAGDSPCAVTAQPVTRHNGTDYAFFHAAGCIYPEERSITWETGFPAAVCMQLYAGSGNSTEETAEYLADFNWQKLIDALGEKTAAESICCDPWKFDKDAVCSAIASRKFSTVLLSTKNCITVETDRLAEEASKHQDSGGKSVPLFLPQYIPSYGRQKDSGLTVVKTGTVNSYLYNIEEIAVITCTSGKDITLEISAVPLYTGWQ
jgi:hypothetical protein